MAVIQPFSAEQERALINMRQRYDVWIEAERELFAMPYDLKRKKIGEYEYLYEIFDRIGNGKSLGAWDEEKEAHSSRFERCVRFNGEIDQEGVTARSRNGQLRIVVPKLKPPVPEVTEVRVQTA